MALFREATEIELSYKGTYLRLYGPGGCEDMDDAYNISKHIPGAITVGDNGGGEAIVVVAKDSVPGIYRVCYGALSPEDLCFVAASLESLLVEARVQPSLVGSCQVPE